MTNEHLSETEIQEYVLNKNTCAKTIVQHIQLCESCKIKAANYQLLFNEIGHQPKPAFDFDISSLVLQQLPQAKPKFSLDKFFVYFFAFVIVSAICVSAYLFRKYIQNIFAGISSLFMYIIIITAAAILIFKSFELYKKYQQKITMLDFY